MHGCHSGSVLLVNAEIDSMGGVVDGGAGVGFKTSPRRAAIEKAQAALRQEYDVREERRRELEFLEKGGNPLDFKSGNAACTSVQSTSLTDQHPKQFVTSDAKGTASPHGDSVESSGRPGTRTVCEPNSADNLLLFDGENELLEWKKNFTRPGKRNSIASSKQNSIAPSKESSQMVGSQNAKLSEDSTVFRPYARRNRSKSIRDGARSNSIDKVLGRGGHESLVSRGGSRDSKGRICETNKQKDQKSPSISNPKPASSNVNMVSKMANSDKQLDGVQGVVVSTGLVKVSLPESKFDVGDSNDGLENRQSLSTQVDDQQPLFGADTEIPDLILSAAIEGPPCTSTTVSGNEVGSGPENKLNILKIDRKSIPKQVQNTCSSRSFGMKGLDSESSCTQTNPCLHVNNDGDVCTNIRNVSSNRNSTEQRSNSEGSPNIVGGENFKKTSGTMIVSGGDNVSGNPASIYQNHTGSGSIVKVEEGIHPKVSGEQDQVKCTHSNMEGQENNVLDSNEFIGNKENSSMGGFQSFIDESTCELPGTTLLEKEYASVPDYQTSDDNLKLVNKAREDSVLEEARIIKAKHKRIAELSVGALPLENRRKSYWDFVLEEMSWLANDFAQERFWKITAAAQMSRVVASASRLRFEEQNQCWKLKRIAHTLSDAVMQFWHSVEVQLNGDISSAVQENSKYDLISSSCTNENDSEKTINTLEHSPPLAVQGYAVRFLKSTTFHVPPFQADAVANLEDVSDMGISEMSWEDHLTEDILFYTVPSGAMEAYRKSVESHLVQCKNTCSSMQEEADTHMYDAIADYGYQESTYDGDEGKTSTYYLPGAFEGSKSSKLAHKKRKNLMKSYSARSPEVRTNMPYGDLTTGAQQPMPMGKKPATNLNVGAIPTKRMRTATRQRVLNPFGAGGLQASANTEASSGDTSSFQDDQSTLHGGSQIQKSGEVESTVDSEKQMRYDSAEKSTKPKKKKKAKHLGTAYDQGWQLDSSVNSMQRDHFIKRTDHHHFESNGTSGLYGQYRAKRPKIANHLLDNTFDSIIPLTGSIPSPAASMSNMSNPNRFIKLMGGRDRGKKSKGLKISAGQPGSGSPWTLFEDQALVVLVHDMGPNWELVSDAVNTTLEFKCIFRKPKECKERHKILMDRSASDGADSADDSGSSQPYPSTLPGIPKGSARQLFQCLQGPMVEDTLKSHFEKIIIIGQKQHYKRSQNENQNPKQIAPVHNSHVIALTQAFPNNLNGSVLTPLDLCDTTPSSPDLLPLGCQGSHTGGLTMSNHGSVASIPPTSGPSSSLQGSSGMALGSNLQSPTGPVSASVRSGVPRTPIPDEHQRMHQYNQMLSDRNVQQSNLSVPGALSGSDRGDPVNGIGMMSGMNRPLPMARPGFQGVTSSPMLNSGGMLSSSIVGMPRPGQGNSVLRPHDALHMMRSGHNSEHQRPGMVPELPKPISQGSTQGVNPINGLSATFSSPTTTPPVQTYAGHTQQHPMPPQQPHLLSNPHHPYQVPGSQQQAYAMRIAKERQQRYMQHPQQFGASNSSMPHAQPQTHHPIASSLPMTQPVSLSPLTPTSPGATTASPHPQNHRLQSGPGRNLHTSNSGLTNQLSKQRQRQMPQQQFQQSGSHAQIQQQAKILKGIGRGNSVNQNISVEPSHPNGVTVSEGSQSGDKGEQIIHPMQSQPSKPLVPSQNFCQSQLQQNLYSSPTPTKPLHQMACHSENNTQGQVPQVASGNTFSSLPQHQKPANQTQPMVQRVLQQNRQVRPDPPGKASVDQAQDQQSVINAPQISTTLAMPQTCADLAKAASVASQWKESEPVPDPGMPNTVTKVACVGNPALSVRNDPIPTVNQESDQSQLSGSIPSHEHNTAAESRLQPQLQQPLVFSPNSTQQHNQTVEHPSPVLQKEWQLDQQSVPSHLLQQQTQHLESG